jgi:methyl-accepting chemotaxis protein
MTVFSNCGIRAKLTAGFLVIATMAGLIGAVGIWATSQVNKMAITMYNQEVSGVRHAGDAQIRLIAAGRAIRSALLATEKGSRISEIYFMRDHIDATKIEVNKLDGMFTSAEGKATVAEASKTVEAYEAVLQQIARRLESSAMETEGGEALSRLLVEAEPLGAMAEMLIMSLILEKQNTSGALADNTSGIYADAMKLMLALTGAGIVLALVLGGLITRGLMRQLGGEPREVVDVVNTIARGDLTTTIDIGRAPSDSVVMAMGSMQDSLRDMVSLAHECSENIAAASLQIASRNTDLSLRTEQQAANLTQTAAAMEQLASTVQSNAEVAQAAAGMASATSRAAEKGGRIVSEVVATMDGIKSSSRRIVDIISVIDGIAFQTNILALNAAVEAARADGQGKGFAVVANEVRSLALKSSAAAKDIKHLIEDSVEQINTGGRLVSAAGAAMVDIVGQIQQVTGMINDISAATSEQTQGIHQVNDAVVRLGWATRQNAELVEASTAVTDDLNNHGAQLAQVMSRFVLSAAQDCPMPEDEEPARALRRSVNVRTNRSIDRQLGDGGFHQGNYGIGPGLEGFAQ